MNNYPFELVVNRKRIKNVYLKIVDNKVIINCNYFFSDREIYRFIDDNYKKIISRLTLIAEKQKISYLRINGDRIYYLGKAYNLIRLKGRSSLKIDNNTIIISSLKNDDASVLNVFYRYMKKELNEIILNNHHPYLEYIKKYLYIDTINYHYQVMRSLWGSCKAKDKKINLNIKLIHFKPEIIKAILVHELAHLIVQNHSKSFYHHVYQMMNDYDLYISELNKYSR